MAKKELELLNGPPEFEKYTAKVRFPSNINGDIQNKVMDKLRLKQDADFSEDMDEKDLLNNVENAGQIFEEMQNRLLDFACKHMKEVESDEPVNRDQLTPSAVDKVLSQYTDQLKGVKVGKN